MVSDLLLMQVVEDRVAWHHTSDACWGVSNIYQGPESHKMTLTMHWPRHRDLRK